MITDKTLEKMLSRLERMYDRDGQAMRDYTRANQEIGILAREGKIDRAHAHILHDAALAKLHQTESHCRNQRERLTRKREAEQWTGSVMPFVTAILLGGMLLVSTCTANALL